MSSKPASTRNKVVSCAECRRLKLRCDRQFPCHNCVKRGLSAICPDGALPTRPKMLMQEADRLNKRNAELSERIRLLEEGLASIQAGISDEIHPLLAKHVSDAPDGGAEPTSVQREVDEVNDSLGTLTIGKDGRSLFLGNTAGIETLFRNESQETGQSESFNWPKQLPSFPNTLHSLGIFSSLHDCKETVIERLQQCLPSSTVASSLVEIYFDHGAWLYNSISMSRFFDEVYNPVYASESGQNTLSDITPHNTALLFIVFALGSFLSNDNDTDTTEHYHQLARTAMSCDAILVDPTMPAIRTLMLMAYYHLLRDKNGSQNCWAMLGLASHMAQNIGLHRDSWRWKLDDAIVQERRALFWELYWLGINQCLSFGRPPSLLLAYCDCEIPHEERLENRAGEIKPGFHLRKFQFASECLSQVVDAVLGIKRTPYSTILALDRKVRDHQALKVPPNGATGPAELGAATVTLTLQRFMLKAIVEMSQYFAPLLNMFMSCVASSLRLPLCSTAVFTPSILFPCTVRLSL
ncbi:fungal-specific transcription factor domain-containing protein [Gautieria morchelliformis]|nr:fungal-specific transcription factor domain-containing protein [Gautieria morchelliformis]